MGHFHDFVDAAAAPIHAAQKNVLRVMSKDGKKLTLYATRDAEKPNGWNSLSGEEDYIYMETHIFVGSFPKGFSRSRKVSPIRLQLPERVIDITYVEEGLYVFESGVDDLLEKHVEHLQ